MKKEKVIKIVNMNEEKEKTCGSCHFTDNDLGLVALHCTCKKAKYMWHDESGKTRSWHSCEHWRKR